MARQLQQRALPARRPLPRTTALRRPRPRFDLSNLRDRLEHFLYNTFANQSPAFNFLLVLTGILTLFGLLMVLSSSAVDSIASGSGALGRFGRQALAAGVGMVFMIVLSRMPLNLIWKLTPKFFGFTIFLQLLTFMPGIGASVGGNRSWINVLGFSFQPAELVKLGLILVLAKLLVEPVGPLYERYGMLGVVVGPSGLALALIMFGQDMGTGGIVTLIVLGMVWLAGIPWHELRRPLLGLGLVVAVLLFFTSSRLPRIQYWLNPSADTSGVYTWQPTHGLWALAGGQIFGSGLGNSRIKWSWLPEAENDFIFAVIGEELGLIGAVAVVVAFLALGAALYRIYRQTANRHSELLVAGVFVYLIVQALVNIAVVVGYGPVLGVPLPLISAGGSSIISSLGAVGVVLAVERENFASGYRAVANAARKAR